MFPQLKPASRILLGLACLTLLSACEINLKAKDDEKVRQEKFTAPIPVGTYVTDRIRTGSYQGMRQVTVAVTESGVKAALINVWVTSPQGIMLPNAEEKSLDSGWFVEMKDGEPVISNASENGNSLGYDQGTLRLKKVEDNRFPVLTPLTYTRYRITPADSSLPTQEFHNLVFPESAFGGQNMSAWDARLFDQYNRETKLASCVRHNSGMSEYSSPTRRLSGSSDPNRWRKYWDECPSKETIEVPAGIFETCRLEEDGVTTWIGNVTSGIVRMVSTKESYGSNDWGPRTPDIANIECTLKVPQTWELEAFTH